MQSAPPTTATPAPGGLIEVAGLSNREFLERYAAPGRVGLSAGMTLIDRAIARAERHIDPARRWGEWSHAFIFEGTRLDGCHWLVESDLQFHRKHIQLGVQEDRIAKYADEQLYTALAVLDFGLTPEQTQTLLRAALDLVADHTKYSLRELAGTLFALRHPSRRGQTNLLARDRAFFCSAFVQHLFGTIGVELVPGVDAKHTTPENLARSPRPHTAWLLQREVPHSKVKSAVRRLRRRLHVRLRSVVRPRRSAETNP